MPTVTPTEPRERNFTSMAGIVRKAYVAMAIRQFSFGGVDEGVTVSSD
jgi:hypothetical protein